MRRLDAQLRGTRKKLAAAVKSSGATLTEAFGVGPVIAGIIIGDVADVFPLPRPRSLRLLQRHRPRRGVLRELRHPHGRDNPAQPRSFPRSSQAIRHLPFRAYRVLI
jgi:hypothetical protein